MKLFFLLFFTAIAGMAIGVMIANNDTTSTPAPPPNRESINIANVGGCVYIVATKGQNGISVAHYAGCTNIHTK